MLRRGLNGGVLSGGVLSGGGDVGINYFLSGDRIGEEVFLG